MKFDVLSLSPQDCDDFEISVYNFAEFYVEEVLIEPDLGKDSA